MGWGGGGGSGGGAQNSKNEAENKFTWTGGCKASFHFNA